MKTIPIVDNKNENLYFLRSPLDECGHEVLRLKNGVAAHKIDRNSPQDIVLSDTLMPVVNDFALFQGWISDVKFKNILFVVHTDSYFDPRNENLVLNLGTGMFILKPMEPKVIMNLLEETINKPQGLTITKPTVNFKEEKFGSLHGISIRLYIEKNIGKAHGKRRSLS